MWLFIVSDTLTFSALLLAYTYSRLANPDWPRPFEIYPAIVKSTSMTVILLFSSLTMVLGRGGRAQERAGQDGALSAVHRAGRAGFAVLHLTEWFNLFHEGYTPWSTPQGVPLFGATFFGITGLHMTHVTIGVIYLIVMADRLRQGEIRRRRRRGQRPLLALRRFGLDVRVSDDLPDVGKSHGLSFRARSA